MRNISIFSVNVNLKSNDRAEYQIEDQIKDVAFNVFKNEGFDNDRAEEYAKPMFAINTEFKDQFYLINWDEYNDNNGENRKDGCLMGSKNDKERHPERFRFSAFSEEQAKYELNANEGETYGTDYIIYLTNMPERFNKLLKKYNDLQNEFKAMVKSNNLIAYEVLDYDYKGNEVSVLGIKADSPRIKREWSYSDDYSEKFGKRTSNKIHKMREQGYMLFCKMNMIVYKLVKKQGMKKFANEHVKVLVKCEYHS